MRVITVKIDEDFLKEVDKYAINHKLNRSEVIRLAVREFLSNHTNYKQDIENQEKFNVKVMYKS